MYVKNEGDEYQLLQDKRIKVNDSNKLDLIKKDLLSENKQPE